ncbi:MAG: glycosyltransferase family 2 protein [Anaerolineae bacterium]|nr:glycosyltransferase family 2 protein [Anaerolineae bacterium]
MLTTSAMNTQHATFPVVPTAASYPKNQQPTVSVVVPTFNEAKNLPHVLPAIPNWVDEVILVDGRSTDDTVEVARRLIPSIRVVMEKRKGKGAALQAGFAAASGDIIVMIDADGSTDPAEIPAYVGALLSGADFAKGSRFLQGGGTADMEFHRRFGNWGLTMMVRVLFGSAYTDLCYGYNAFWARVLPLLDLDGDGFEIETMMNIRALKAGLSIAEIPSFEDERIHGASNLRTFPDGWRVLKTIVKEWAKNRGARAVQRNRKFEAEDAFTPAVQSLFQEALALSRSCEHLSTEAYEKAAESLRLTYRALLNQETNSAAIRRLQTRYRKHYNNDAVWAFLEECACISC